MPLGRWRPASRRAPARPEMALRALALVEACEGSLERARRRPPTGSSGRNGTEAMWWPRPGSRLTALWRRAGATRCGGGSDRTGLAPPPAGRLRGAVRLDPSPERIEAWQSWADLTKLAWSSPRSKPATVEWPNHGPRQLFARGRARVAIADGDIEAAIAATSIVAVGPPPGWSRFDIGRVLLVRGEALRHARSRRDSDEAPSSSRDFADLGAIVGRSAPRPNRLAWA